MVPDDLAVSGVKERDSIAPKAHWVAGCALRVPLRLCQDILWTEGQLLGLNDTEKLARIAQGVVGWTIVGRELLNCAAVVRRKGLAIAETNHPPARSFELWVDQAFPRKPLRVSGQGCAHGNEKTITHHLRRLGNPKATVASRALPEGRCLLAPRP